MATRRAVAPSINFDVGPVLRHCMRARKNILIRDLVLVGITLLAVLVLLVAGLLGPLAEVLILALLLAGAWITRYNYIRTTYTTLVDDLRIGAQPPGPVSGAAEDRLALVEGAQWGNVTLHGGFFPFIGAGVESQAHWSIAIRLDAVEPERQAVGVRSSTGRYARIDAVELHARIQDRLLALNDPALPANERVGSLEVSDRLIGSGTLRPDSPLIDRTRNTPYSHASNEAIQAFIRHPQAGLRYYQQVTVNDLGPTVMSGGRKVLDGVDRQVSVSAFVYAAVEGHMLYLQYVLTALPPILAEYRIIDYLPSTSSPEFGRTVRREARKHLFSSLIFASLRLYSAFQVWRTERLSASTYQAGMGGDLSARISVRHLGTANRFGTYTRELDVEKYNSIFSRLLVETVQDFLEENGVDTSAFENSARNVINNGEINLVSGNKGKIDQVGGRRDIRGSSGDSGKPSPEKTR
jgi:hypothetical protein